MSQPEKSGHPDIEIRVASLEDAMEFNQQLRLLEERTFERQKELQKDLEQKIEASCAALSDKFAEQLAAAKSELIVRIDAVHGVLSARIFAVESRLDKIEKALERLNRWLLGALTSLVLLMVAQGFQIFRTW